MKKNHLLIVSVFAILAFVFILVQSISPSSSAAGVQCNPERLNQVYDIESSGFVFLNGGRNISGAFLVPLEHSYAKVYNIINASFVGSCSVMNSDCDYYINEVYCGSIPTNMTTLLNRSGGKQFYPISCLSLIKSGTNILTLNLDNSYGSGAINEVLVELEIAPANC